MEYLTVYAFSTENWKRSPDEVDALMKLFRRYTKTCIRTARDNNMKVRVLGDPTALADDLQESLKKLVDEIAANTPFYYVDQQEILGKVDFWERYETLAFKLVNEVQIMDIKDELQQKVKERVDKHQKEYILREQLKLIREELGDDSTLSDAEEFEKAAKNLKAPKEVKEKLKKEISRFKSSLNSPAESGVIRTYIETLLEMPWDKAGKDNQDIKYAEEVLELSLIHI